MFSIFNKSKSINVNDLDNLLDNINLIDIREPSETKSGILRGAKKVPMNKLLSNPDDYLDKNKEYYLICHSGMRSDRAVTMLNSQGFNTINVGGGFSSYVGSKIER